MTRTEVTEIFETVYTNNARKLINWALKRLLSVEDAEELCQETMFLLYKKIIQIKSEDDVIRNIDNYLWKIAHSVFCDYCKDSKRKIKLVKDAVAQYDDFHYDEETETPEASSLRAKLKKSISMLDFNHRESMIMYYLEKKTLSEISEKLNISESYANKLLFQSRQTIRDNDKKQLYDRMIEYRPEHLPMSFLGEIHPSPDFVHITQCLSKQNICLLCYNKPLSTNEINELTGLPMAYLEFDLNLLENKGFMKKSKNKYSTEFFIFDTNFRNEMTNVFMRNKTYCIDKIIEKLYTQEERIKKIGFIGAGKPFDVLLWLLICRFTNLASSLTCFRKTDHGFDVFKRFNAGQYFPVGIFKTEPTVSLNTSYIEKYMNLDNWVYDGFYAFDDRNNKLNWLGLYPPNENTETFHSFFSLVFEERELLFKIIKPNFNIDALSDQEKFTLTKLIQMRCVSVSENNGRIYPNFYIFTPNQNQILEYIFLEIYEDMKPEFTQLYIDLLEMCKNKIPKHIAHYLDYIVYITMLFSHYYATGFAYYDGKLYQPTSMDEHNNLTLCMTSSSKEVDTKQKMSVTLNLNVYSK